MQTKRMSFIESVCNVAVGYVVAIGSQLIVFPWFGIYVSFGDNVLIGVVFTVVSLARSYCLRRLFNNSKRLGAGRKHD